MPRVLCAALPPPPSSHRLPCVRAELGVGRWVPGPRWTVTRTWGCSALPCGHLPPSCPYQSLDQPGIPEEAWEGFRQQPWSWEPEWRREGGQAPSVPACRWPFLLPLGNRNRDSVGHHLGALWAFTHPPSKPPPQLPPREVGSLPEATQLATSVRIQTQALAPRHPNQEHD